MAIEINAADVVLCEFYFSDLNQSKKRPVLVLKDDLPHNDFVGIPISSQLRELHQDEILVDSSKFSEGGLPIPELFREDGFPFQIEVSGGKFPNFKVEDFYEKFCQALSLSCNSAVQISLKWRLWAEDELFNLSGLGVGGIARRYDANSFGSFAEAGEAQIQEVKRLYHILVGLDSNVKEKLQIPIDRWIKSKASRNVVDKMIDLGIAFESIYLSDIKEKTELSFRLRLYASWHLGKDTEERKMLMKEFRTIYNCRSDAVHNGKLDEKIKLGGERIPISEFIEKAQDLCRESIIKIMEDGQFPDWNDVILGSEVESAAVGLDKNPRGLG